MVSIPRRDSGETDDAWSGGNYRVALSGRHWPAALIREGRLSAQSV